MTTIAPPTTANSAAKAARGLARSREIGILLALVLLLAVTTVLSPGFLFGPDGLRDLLLTPAILVVLTVGEAIVLITRNIDLSVASMLGLSAWLTGRLFVQFPQIPILVVFLAGIALGVLLGLVNGVLVAFARAPALVITLGTLYAYRGINVMWSNSKMINASNMPKDFLSFGVGTFAGIPNLALVALVVVIVAGWYMRFRSGGREFYAIGSDPDAARLYGLNVNRRILVAFGAAGALAGLSGVMWAARYGTIDSHAGSGLELSAVAAAVVGGVAIFGGSGSIVGAAIGAILLVTINRTLPILGVQDFWQRAVVGVLILAAIVLDRILTVRQAHKLDEIRDEHNV
jgi:rhamnose transport system permease protein